MQETAMIWLDTPDALTRFLQENAHAAWVGMDTEFIRERTYYPQLALVQLIFDDTIALVDAAKPAVAAALKPLLENPAVLKIMHSCSEDLQAFKAGCQAVPSPVFDTQTAAALCGLGFSLSYLKIVEQLCQVSLEKGETRSDWLQRPLTDSQKQYAADDVRFLLPIYRELQQRLHTLGREYWLAEDCARAVANAIDDLPDSNPHLAVRSNQPLGADEQRQLRRILLWRDARAVEKNKPKRWIIDNDAAFALARAPLRDADDIEAVFARYPKAPRSAKHTLFALLQKPFNAEELAAPIAREADAAAKSKLKALQQAVLQQAQALNVPEGLLASRKHLEFLLDAGQWPQALQGWRQQLLDEAFTPILTPS
jgi:ribonuclease D